MSAEYPIIAITGSSGAGSSVVIKALQHIFFRERVKAAYIDGSAFHRYDRKTMQAEVKQAQAEGRNLTHFGPEGNHFDKLETLFIQYANTGTGVARQYLHTQSEADKWGQQPGTFTPWEPMDRDSDLLLYRGLHGAVVAGDVNVAQYPDLHIGMAPNANLEWMRKIQRDTQMRGYAREDVMASILERLRDYVDYITPQFSRTHINFQMVPLVDTSDPFGEEAVPDAEECALIIHFQQGVKHPDFQKLVKLIPGARMSRRSTLMVPGKKMLLAIETILLPIIHDLVVHSRELRHITDVPKSRGTGLLETGA